MLGRRMSRWSETCPGGCLVLAVFLPAQAAIAQTDSPNSARPEFDAYGNARSVEPGHRLIGPDRNEVQPQGLRGAR